MTKEYRQWGDGKTVLIIMILYDMKNKLKIIFLFLLFSFNSFAQQSEQDKKMAWWREARFGMFIH